MSDEPLPPPIASSPPVSPAPAALDPKLPLRALQRIRGLVKGNGLDPEAVALDGCEARVYSFSAKITIRLEPKYGIRIEPGRNLTAQLVGSQEELLKEIHLFALRVKESPEKRKLVTDVILTRPDQGFFMKDQRTGFHALRHDLVIHEACGFCSKSGKTPCGKCSGHGMIPCAKCRGRKHIFCPKCRGSGKIQTPRGIEACATCHADGSVLCPLCRGQGQVKCAVCAATGNVKCGKCAGTGWLSHLAHIEMEAGIHFEYDRSGLPEQVSRMIATFGPKLIERGDIEIQLRPQELELSDPALEKKTEGEPAADRSRQEAVIVLEYDAKVPFGPIRFQFPDRIVPGALFGYQGRVIEAPSFLDDLTKLGQQVLSDAALGKGHIAGNILRAAKYQMLKDVIVETALRGSLRKAHTALASRYTAGIFSEKIARLVGDAEQALRNATRMPRYIGLGGGLGVFSGVALAYFFGGGRLLLAGAGLPEIVLAGCDAALAPLGAALGVAGARFAALYIQRRLLKGMIPPEQQNKIILPKAGKTMWWAIGGAVAIVLANLFAVSEEAFAPAWLGVFLMP